MKKIGFIGTGNIARSIAMGLAYRNYDLTQVMVSGKDSTSYEKSKTKFQHDFGVSVAQDNSDLVSTCDVVILAVEPKHFKGVADEVKSTTKAGQVFISLGPDCTTEELATLLGSNIKTARAMPNTPSAVAEGMTAMAFQSDKFDEAEKKELIDFFSIFSHVEVIDEKLIDMVTAMSGSAPAYMYMVLEAMADAGAIIGFPRNLSYTFAAQSMIGSATMLKELPLHPFELKDQLCLPGGTTVEAIQVFEKNNLKGTIIEGILECYKKSCNLI